LGHTLDRRSAGLQAPRGLALLFQSALPRSRNTLATATVRDGDPREVCDLDADLDTDDHANRHAHPYGYASADAHAYTDHRAALPHPREVADLDADPDAGAHAHSGRGNAYAGPVLTVRDDV
jgi:hypothetical protein